MWYRFEWDVDETITDFNGSTRRKLPENVLGGPLVPGCKIKYYDPGTREYYYGELIRVAASRAELNRLEVMEEERTGSDVRVPVQSQSEGGEKKKNKGAPKKKNKGAPKKKGTCMVQAGQAGVAKSKKKRVVLGERPLQEIAIPQLPPGPSNGNGMGRKGKENMEKKKKVPADGKALEREQARQTMLRLLQNTHHTEQQPQDTPAEHITLVDGTPELNIQHEAQTQPQDTPAEHTTLTGNTPAETCGETDTPPQTEPINTASQQLPQEDPILLDLDTNLTLPVPQTQSNPHTETIRQTTAHLHTEPNIVILNNNSTTTQITQKTPTIPDRQASVHSNIEPDIYDLDILEHARPLDTSSTVPSAPAHTHYPHQTNRHVYDTPTHHWHAPYHSTPQTNSYTRQYQQSASVNYPQQYSQPQQYPNTWNNQWNLRQNDPHQVMLSSIDQILNVVQQNRQTLHDVNNRFLWPSQVFSNDQPNTTNTISPPITAGTTHSSSQIPEAAKQSARREEDPKKAIRVLALGAFGEATLRNSTITGWSPTRGKTLKLDPLILREVEDFMTAEFEVTRVLVRSVIGTKIREINRDRSREARGIALGARDHETDASLE